MIQNPPPPGLFVWKHVLLDHLGHLLAVNAQGTSGTAPNGSQGVQLTAIILHCQECDTNVTELPL